jgi:hypothetical protein
MTNAPLPATVTRMGKTLRFSGPDAGRATTIFRDMTTGNGEGNGGNGGNQGNGDNTDFHALGEAVITAVAEQIRQEDRARRREEADSGVRTAEKYTPAQAHTRFVAWEALDLDGIPDPVWACLHAGAYSAIEAVSESDLHDRIFNVAAINDPHGSGDRVLAVTCLHNDDSEQGRYGQTAPVHGDMVLVFDQDQSALARITELQSHDPEPLQGWWIGALQETARDFNDDDHDFDVVTDIVVRSVTTNVHYPFPDATGQIRCRHGVTFEIVDTSEQDAAIRAVREAWRDDHAISDSELVESLGNLATGILGQAMYEFGREGLVTGYTVDGNTVQVGMLTDDEREVGLPGIEIVTAPGNGAVPYRLERAAGGSAASANAAWIRALESAVDRVARSSGHSRDDILHVVERSAVMLAERELSVD